jgi:outer membrane lipoprotein-sorting protein
MRLMLVVLLLQALVRADDDAEKRVRAMEKKLEAAKSLQVAFEARAEGVKESGTMKGTLTLAEGNKLHLDGTIEIAGKSLNFKRISDGANTTEEGLDGGTRPTSKTLTEDYRRSLTHGGFIAGFYLSTEADGVVSWPVFRASEFELGKPDNLRTRRAQIVDCKLTPAAKGGKTDVAFSEALWLDLETSLPLKRVFTGTLNGKKITFTETYETLTLDPKVDAKMFEVSK